MAANLIALPEQKTKVEIAKSRMHALEHLRSYVMECVRSEIIRAKEKVFKLADFVQYTQGHGEDKDKVLLIFQTVTKKIGISRILYFLFLLTLSRKREIINHIETIL